MRILALFIILCAAIRPAMAGPPEGYELVWSDEFDQLNLADDGSGWNDHFRIWNVRALDGNNDQGLKVSNDWVAGDGRIISHHLSLMAAKAGIAPPFLHKVEHGTLQLRTFPSPSPEITAGLPYLASMISGQDMHSQSLGYWEVRFRAVNIPAGHHIALWLLPDDHRWPPEIDLLEIVGSEPGRFFANAHGSDGPAITYMDMADPRGWHTASFEWTRNEMIWRLDGQIWRQQRAYIDQATRLYFLASFEIGSDWPGPVDHTTVWPGLLELDYVRAYQRMRP